MRYLLIPMAEEMLSESDQKKLSRRLPIMRPTIGTDLDHLRAESSVGWEMFTRDRTT